VRTEESVFVGPDDGKALPNPVGGRMVVNIRDKDTAGAYSIHDNTIPAGSPGPRPHIHHPRPIWEVSPSPSESSRALQNSFHGASQKHEI
jgi:hypothetical protein